MTPTGGRAGRQHHPPARGGGQRHTQERPAFLLPHCQRQRGPPFQRRPGRPAVALCSTQKEGQTPSPAQDTGNNTVCDNRVCSAPECRLSYSAFLCVFNQWEYKKHLLLYLSDLILYPWNSHLHLCA